MRVAVLSLVVLCACDGYVSEQAEDDVMGVEGETRRGKLLLDDQPIVDFLEVDGMYLVDGDTLYSKDLILPLPDGADDVDVSQSSLLGLTKKHRWPNGRVPFVFHSDVSHWMRARIKAGMAMWEDTTPVRFVPRESGDDDYLFIKTWDNTYSYATAGDVHSGAQTVMIDNSGLSAATTEGIACHEFGHSLGLKHEQMRPDRDDYVTVHFDNIKDGFKSNYRKLKDGVVTFGKYDVHSIMGYGSYFFSKNGKPTLTRKDGTTFGANFDQPTKRDSAGVTQWYDTERPSVRLVGVTQTLSNPATLTADASDDYRIDQVEFLADGEVFATAESKPWTATYKHGGQHVFTARATDMVGKVTTSDPVTAVVACDGTH